MINGERADNEIQNPIIRRMVIVGIGVGVTAGIISVGLEVQKAAEKMPQPLVDTIAVGGGSVAAGLTVYLLGRKT